MKLSDRLRNRLDETEKAVNGFGLSISNLSADHEYFILSECLKLVRAVEDAPTVEVSEVYIGWRRGKVRMIVNESLIGKRVSIVSLEDTP